MQPLLVTNRELCEMLRIGKTQLFRLLPDLHRRGMMPVRLGRSVRYRVADVERIIGNAAKREERIG